MNLKSMIFLWIMKIQHRIDIQQGERIMEKIGVIDIGANTMRLVIWEIREGGVHHLVDELKETVRVADDIDTLGIVSESKIIETLQVLRNFKVLTEAMETTKVFTMASETMRRAGNSDEIITRIKEELDLDIVMMSDEEESYYDYLGIVKSMRLKNSLIVDIGGASTQLIWIHDGKMKEYASIPVGTLNLTRRYNLNDVVSPVNHIEMERHLNGIMENISWLQSNFFYDIIAVGGSARTIGKVDRRKKRYPLSLTHNYPMYDSDVINLYVSCMSKSLKQRYKIEGLSKDRADIILGALAIMTSILKTTGIQNLRISGKGIREGIIYDYIEKTYGVIPDMLDRSIENIIYSHGVEVTHSETVYYLTEKLFKGLRPLHKIGDEYDDIIKLSTLLHDVGLSIRYYDHEKHSFYIIINSEINGMSHKDILLSAFAAGYHRNYNYELSNVNYNHILNRLDLHYVEKLGLCMSIAECFDRSLSNVVYDIDVEIGDTFVKIIPYSNFNLTLEISEAMKVSERFAEIFKKDLVIESKVQKDISSQVTDR